MRRHIEDCSETRQTAASLGCTDPSLSSLGLVEICRRFEEVDPGCTHAWSWNCPHARIPVRLCAQSGSRAFPQ